MVVSRYGGSTRRDGLKEQREVRVRAHLNRGSSEACAPYPWMCLGCVAIEHVLFSPISFGQIRASFLSC